MPALVWYITAHGFGHAVRSAQVLAALQRRAPALELHVRAAAPAWLFPAGVHYHHLAANVGLVQRDGLTQDLAATLERARAFAAERPAAVAREVGFLRQVGAALVVGDVPPLAFRAARAAGLSAVGMANFSWDWIYAHFAAEQPAFRELAQAARDAYATATLLLRLPFHGDLGAFPRIVDIPLVARPTPLSRAVCRARLGLPVDRRLVLLSFGGDGLDRFPFARLAAWPEYLFLTTDRVPEPWPANLRVLPAHQSAYQELVRACDVIVAKPGYGIVADCLAAQTPMLYTDRGDFPEYPILVEGLEESGPALHLPREVLLAGEVGPALDRLLALDRPWRVPRLDGAAVAVEHLLGFLDEQPAAPAVGAP